jgi:hypothetical protein
VREIELGVEEIDLNLQLISYSSIIHYKQPKVEVTLTSSKLLHTKFIKELILEIPGGRRLGHS